MLIENIKSNYGGILPRGKGNAVSAAALAERLGFSSVRTLQLDISEARETGILILSSAKGGYYLPCEDETGIAEVEDFFEIEERIKYFFNFCVENELRPTVELMALSVVNCPASTRKEQDTWLCTLQTF